MKGFFFKKQERKAMPEDKKNLKGEMLNKITSH